MVYAHVIYANGISGRNLGRCCQEKLLGWWVLRPREAKRKKISRYRKNSTDCERVVPPSICRELSKEWKTYPKKEREKESGPGPRVSRNVADVKNSEISTRPRGNDSFLSVITTYCEVILQRVQASLNYEPLWSPISERNSPIDFIWLSRSRSRVLYLARPIEIDCWDFEMEKVICFARICTNFIYYDGWSICSTARGKI